MYISFQYLIQWITVGVRVDTVTNMGPREEWIKWIQNNLLHVSPKRHKCLTVRSCSTGFQSIPVKHKLNLSLVRSAKRIFRFGFTSTEFEDSNKIQIRPLEQPASNPTVLIGDSNISYYERLVTGFKKILLSAFSEYI